jgi:hypothetical protein
MQGPAGAGDHFHLECRFIATVSNQSCLESHAFLLPLQTSMSPCASRYHSISMQCNRHLSAQFFASSLHFLRPTRYNLTGAPPSHHPRISILPPRKK